MSITICNDLKKLRKSKHPVLQRYANEMCTQPAHIELWCESGKVRAAYWPGGRNETPEDVWHGHCRWYDISSNASGQDLADLLEDPTFLDLLQRVADGYEEDWDGRNHVAVLDEDAKDAETEIHKMIVALGLVEPPLDPTRGLGKLLPRQLLP